MYNVEHRLKGFDTQEHRADVCVVGGGLAGLCAAVAAARGGAKTVLIHDRPLVECMGRDPDRATIDRALKHGWDIGNTGRHNVRRNHIHDCLVAGSTV